MLCGKAVLQPLAPTILPPAPFQRNHRAFLGRMGKTKKSDAGILDITCVGQVCTEPVPLKVAAHAHDTDHEHRRVIVDSLSKFLISSSWARRQELFRYEGWPPKPQVVKLEEELVCPQVLFKEDPPGVIHSDLTRDHEAGAGAGQGGTPQNYGF
ncbi:hypothetical protein PG997_004146 [Apiospora hydei]|uniref:Uncharacterized protein n=1 Tax=Apiospora hydei TaxID=1337664 RepID=A0ABR1X1E1_9PEZI